MGLLRPPGETLSREDRVKIVTAPGRYDARDFERLDKLSKRSKPDDFLALVPEPGQTAEEFAREEKDRLPPLRRSIRFFSYSAGESAPTPALVRALSVFAEAAFPGTAGELGPARPIPDEFFEDDDDGDGVEADRILDDLLDFVGVDVLAVVALAATALFSGPRDAVGGLSSFRRRITVVSLPFHAEGADELLFLRRMIGAIAHDVGHVLGIAHCVFYRCVMNGAATDAALDERPIHFCPVCEEKIGIALGVSDVARHESRRKLLAFYREYGLVPEARFLEKRLKRGE